MTSGDHYFVTDPIRGGIVEVTLLFRVATRHDCWYVDYASGKGCGFVVLEKDLLASRPEVVGSRSSVVGSDRQPKTDHRKPSPQLSLFAEVTA